MNSEKLKRTVKSVTDLLAAESYAELEKLTGSKRLPADEIKQAVIGYGQDLIPLPGEGYDALDVIEVNGKEPKQWSVNVPIYSRKEGMSDLTLELTLLDSTSDMYVVEIDNLHIL